MLSGVSGASNNGGGVAKQRFTTQDSAKSGDAPKLENIAAGMARTAQGLAISGIFIVVGQNRFSLRFAR